MTPLPPIVDSVGQIYNPRPLCVEDVAVAIGHRPLLTGSSTFLHQYQYFSYEYQYFVGDTLLAKFAKLVRFEAISLYSKTCSKMEVPSKRLEVQS